MRRRDHHGGSSIRSGGWSAYNSQRDATTSSMTSLGSSLSRCPTPLRLRHPHSAFKTSRESLYSPSGIPLSPPSLSLAVTERDGGATTGSSSGSGNNNNSHRQAVFSWSGPSSISSTGMNCGVPDRFQRWGSGRASYHSACPSPSPSGTSSSASAYRSSLLTTRTPYLG